MENVIKKLIESRIAELICSRQLRVLRHSLSDFLRKVARQGHRAVFYFDLEDPYSTLMLPIIEELEHAFKVSFSVEIVEPRRSEFCPEPDLLQRHALTDAGYLAQAWGMEFPSLIPSHKRIKQEALRLLLLERNTVSEWFQLAKEVTRAYWRGDLPGIRELISIHNAIDAFDITETLKKNTDRFYDEGHFHASSIYYRGESYWNLDRLYLLKERLSRFQGQEHITKFYPNWGNVRVPSHPNDPVELFFSFRSPYSYIAIARIFLNKGQYPTDSIKLRPIMPMVDRGLPLPKQKKMYILKDAARVAHFDNIPFGRVRDPLGKGVDACMAFFEATPNEQKLDVVFHLMRDIWANGKDVSSDHYIEQLCNQFKLPSSQVKIMIQQRTFSKFTEENRKALLSLRLWGVPSFKKGKLVTWGQDRMPLVFERAFK